MKRGVIKVATCQFAVGDDVRRNAAAVRRQMARAHKLGADAAHFPEAALTGYPPSFGRSDWNGFDWDLLRSETEQIMAEARRLRIWVIVGSAHPLSGRNKPHNSLYAISSEGRIVDRYDKCFCTGGDLRVYSPGDHLSTFTINGVRCGMLICYDVRFCELYRAYYKLGVRFMFHAFHNAMAKAETIHTIIMTRTAQAMAAMNNMFVSATNSSRYFSLWPSAFITPDGRVQSRLKFHRAGLTVDAADTNKDYYDASRPFRDRAVRGVLHSGTLVKDPRSKDRTSL